MSFDNLFTSLLNMLKDFLYWAVNTFIEIAGKLIDLAVGILPEYTMPTVNFDTTGFPKFLSTLNWLFPVDVWLLCVQALVFSTVLYFTVGVVTRWAKVT